MMASGKDILIRFKRKWQLLQWIEIFIYALGPAILVYLLTPELLWSLISFFITVVTLLTLKKPWKLSLETISSYIDQKLEAVEYSSGLLLLSEDQLSSLAKLQQHKVSKLLRDQIENVRPVNNLFRATVIMASFVALGFIVFHLNLVDYLQSPDQQNRQSDVINFQPTDTVASGAERPRLEKQQVTISYPIYTKRPSLTTSEMNIKAVGGSRLSWHLKFDTEVGSVMMESMGNSYPMKLINGVYTQSIALSQSGFYNFRFTDTLGASYLSELYSIEVTKDQSPVIEVQGLKQFTSFDHKDDKLVDFKTTISDDFGIADAYIIATVSKGTGESVKFREEKLSFDGHVISGRKSLELSKSINLDNVNMEPGDELYFYIEALDLKQPKPNKSRSETFFAVIKDTTSYEFAVEGSLGVNLMPDYFRSQRQLIIDTEMLIANRAKLPKKEFNSTSNELGYDQKALRLKYGQFMGDESDSGIGPKESPEMADEEHVDEDPLAEYTHDHDGDNEHNLVDHENHEGEGEDDKEDLLHDYLHNHGDPEEATIFEESLKSKLRQALNEMWDAELYLRLYEPENSLPYQYKALKIIQDIKNSARIYVHRIGFDPPPIKEDKRLTGKIDEVANFQKIQQLGTSEKFPFMRQSIEKIEHLISLDIAVSDADRKLFGNAGIELSAIAIEEPGRYLKTLQQLKKLSENRGTSSEMMVEVQRGLYSAIPESKTNPSKGKELMSEINKLLLKELESDD